MCARRVRCVGRMAAVGMNPPSLQRSQTAPPSAEFATAQATPEAELARAPTKSKAIQRNEAPVYSPKRRVWIPGRREPPPFHPVRVQLSASVSGIDQPNEIAQYLAAKKRNKWFDELAARKLKQKAIENRRRIREEDDLDLLDAQMNALSVMMNEKAFINPVDRATLMGLVSNLRNLNAPTEPSPLTAPAVSEITEGPKIFRIRPSRYVGEEHMESGSRDKDLNLLCARTITYAHKRAEKMKGKDTHRAAPSHPQDKVARSVSTSALSLVRKSPAASAPALMPEPEPSKIERPMHYRPPPKPKHSRPPPAPLGFGLRWYRIGGEKPPDRVLLANDALAKAIERKTVFTRAEWESFWPAGVPEVRKEHIVRAAKSVAYFQPYPSLQRKESWRAPSPTPSATSGRSSPDPDAIAKAQAEAQAQLARDLGAQKRMAKQFPSLGLVHRKLVEQREEAARQAAERAMLQERRLAILNASKRPPPVLGLDSSSVTTAPADASPNSTSA